MASASPVPDWQALIEAMLDAVLLIDAKSLQVKGANSAAVQLLATSLDALLGKPVLELAGTPEDICFWADVAQGLDESIVSDTLIGCADGSTKPITRRICRIESSGGSAAFVLVMHDRSEQLRVERELEGAAADLRATLESTHDGILVVDLSGRIRNVNRRFAELWQIPADLLTRHEDDSVLEWMRRSVIDPGAYMRRLAALDDATMAQASDVLKLHCGTVLERVTVPQCMRGRPIGRIFSFRDITERLQARDRIETLSSTDALTGLPNRRLLSDRCDVALATFKRDAMPFALLFLNLDRFNHINETLGRSFGDHVLLDVAERIKSCLRQIDTVARLGGDEFVILANQADDRGAERTAWRVLNALKRPFSQGDLSFTVTASIGIALCPGDGSSLDELLRRGESAMREVKLAGRAGFRFHHTRPDRDDGQSRSRMRLDHAMRMALSQERFRLHYQPQVDVRDGRVVGAEALIRWRDPELGEISPAEFIPVAEESGFIIAIGDWVLRHAVAQAAAWVERGRAIPISVNVSALQFQQPGFVDGVARVLREAQLDPQWLELELTESILIQDAQDAMCRLEALAGLGVKLAIDDFGTGYSSLAYLKRFPIGRLKIDQSFVSGLPGQPSDVAIVQAIIHMGQALRLETVAEGVETESQRKFLQDAGCDVFQGYLYAPALGTGAFEERVGTRQPAAADGQQAAPRGAIRPG
jgi:diguanylate cyclase (GGDEF)-like protein/PAS domain S-box-containing protein